MEMAFGIIFVFFIHKTYHTFKHLKLNGFEKQKYARKYIYGKVSWALILSFLMLLFVSQFFIV